jgi:WhiB family redox-sensing transcriptional regulator
MSNQTWEFYADFMKVKDAVGVTPCESNPDAFFPEDAESTSVEHEQRRIAKKLCEMCPIKIECLNYALQANEVYGIWGGMSQNKLKELRKRMK